MDQYYLFLVLLGVLAVAGLGLYLREHRKQNQKEASVIRPPRTETTHSALYNYEKTATDQFLYDRCCRYMTEHKPFLVESFSLQDLSNALHTNRAYLSQAINRFSGKNFRAYVNYYRIIYAMDLFKVNMSLRVTDLTELSGFHSITSFYKSFKGITGEPPSHWCSRLRREKRQRLKNK